MRFEFATEQWLPLPLETVFAFFANPANLPPLMPGWQKARIDSVRFCPPPPPPPGCGTGIAAGDGTELLITARPFPWSPLRGKWLARIEDFRWNDRFCDVQLEGPFRFWRHCHSVHAAPHPGTGRGQGTLVRDQVEYELPLLRNGRLANRFFMQPIMKQMFRYRHERAEKLLLTDTVSV